MDKISVVISSPVDTYSGYGARARDFVKAVMALDKYDVKLLSQRWGNTRFGYLEDHGEAELKLMSEEFDAKYFELKRVEQLTSEVIATFIAQYILQFESSVEEFNIDDWWDDLKSRVLEDCQQKFTSVDFITNEGVW